MDLANVVDLSKIIEAVLLANGQPMTIEQLIAIFDEVERPSKEQVKQALSLLEQQYEGRGIELKEVATGFRLQTRTEFSQWVSRLWEEKPQRYSRALLETLALIAYRQPITRGEIEDIRGVTVSSHIIKTLQERDWIRVVGYKEVPGKPAMLATTKTFLDYFNLKSLEELPSLSSMDMAEPETILTQEFEFVAAENENSVIEAAQLTEEKGFKHLLEEWDQMEDGLKVDFDDIEMITLQLDTEKSE